ncbi:MAG: DNA-3-methyladenine glycosylase [Clostridia bacterium]|nr:DNA-3-methyladenine glycosylase [Clostridia bacterium]
MIAPGKLLEREFYLRDTLTVAKELLGCRLTVLNSKVSLKSFSGNEVCLNFQDIYACGIICETEGYLGLSDKACHSYKANKNGRTNIMYGKGGFAYIYLVYGLHNCFNVVTQGEGIPEAVLIRALQPEDGQTDIRKFSGPGKLCKSAGITRADYGADLCAESETKIIITKPENYFSPQITAAKRIGVDYSGEAADYLYRFYITDSKSVSKK